MNATVGPFLHVDYQQRVSKGTRELLVLTYRARNAGGLIGYEQNGVAIVQTKPAPVILVEGLARQPSGYYGVAHGQKASFDELAGKTFDDLADTVNRLGQLPWTYGVNDPWVKTKADRAMTRAMLNEANDAIANWRAYDARLKEDWKRAGGRFMRRLAKDLGTKTTPHFNAAGIACSGDWSLSAPDVGIYITFNAEKYHAFAGYWRKATAEDPFGAHSMNRHVRLPADLDEYRALLARMKGGNS